MIIFAEKFGTMLASRPQGKEAWQGFLPTLRAVQPGEEVIVDFAGIETLGPSWADEFLTPLHAKFGDSVVLRNLSEVSDFTIAFLEGIHGYSIRRESGLHE